MTAAASTFALTEAWLKAGREVPPTSAEWRTVRVVAHSAPDLNAAQVVRIAQALCAAQ